MVESEIPDTIYFEYVTGEYIASRLKVKLPKRKRPPLSGKFSEDQYYLAVSKDRQQYRLFLTRIDYIAFLLNHYFTKKNLDNDTYIRLHLVHFKGVPIESLRGYPRLAETNFKHEEVINAVSLKLPHLKTYKNESNEDWIAPVEPSASNFNTFLSSLATEEVGPYDDWLARKLYFNP